MFDESFSLDFQSSFELPPGNSSSDFSSDFSNDFSTSDEAVVILDFSTDFNYEFG